MNSKTGPALVEAFKVILTSGRKPEEIMTDQGTEFLIGTFKVYGKVKILNYLTRSTRQKLRLLKESFAHSKQRCDVTLLLREP